ncbi:MAG: hypothetical protein HY815_11015 [Candidatus Riflebacteria bacterium]|nr:hypothetical protein [Candidatus Riflebacteria bacterium]
MDRPIRRWALVPGLLVGAALLIAARAGQAAEGDGRDQRTVGAMRHLTGFKFENKPENLRSLFGEIRAAIARNDRRRASVLGYSLIPNESRIKAGLREDRAGGLASRIMALQQSQLPARLEEIYIIFAAEPALKEIRVHSATTEEIARSAEGPVASKDFPGAVRKIAERHLRPGVTFNVVELAGTRPEDSIRYHLIYWDGSQWSMLGPIWNGID